MKMKSLTFAASLITVATISACSTHPGATFTPTQCKKTDRHGVYLFEFTTESGDCGMQASGLVNFDDSASGAGCSVSGATWSEGDCKYAATVRCAATSSSPATEGTMVTTQQTQDGSSMTGTLTLQVDGAHGCFGTYSVHGTRK